MCEMACVFNKATATASGTLPVVKSHPTIGHCTSNEAIKQDPCFIYLNIYLL